MELCDRMPLILGTIKFVVQDKKGRIRSECVIENAITEGLFAGIPGLINIDNVADAGKITAKGIDFYTSESGAWRTGSGIANSNGGSYAETYVAHIATFTADDNVETVKRLRLRRTNFNVTDWTTNAWMLAHVTNLTVAMSSGWTLKADWLIRTA